MLPSDFPARRVKQASSDYEDARSDEAGHKTGQPPGLHANTPNNHVASPAPIMPKTTLAMMPMLLRVMSSASQPATPPTTMAAIQPTPELAVR